MNFQNDTALNPQQQEAATYLQGPSIILAGAGSGKTRVLVQKVQNLIESKLTDPSAILMITFTNKAAGEMKERIGQTALGYVGTFHSLSARLLRIDGEAIGLPRSFTIYDKDDQTSLIKELIKASTTTQYSPSYLLHRISTAKNEMIGPSEYLSIFHDHASAYVAEMYAKYQKALRKNHAADFDDLIMRAIELLSTQPSILSKYQKKYEYILVDEFQDTNKSQYVLTKLLAQGKKNITVVGDFSQSIYSWRGADIKNLERLTQDFRGTKTFRLEQNYRSTKPILDFAYAVISKNDSHPILTLRTNRLGGEEVQLTEVDNEQDEALYITGEIERLSDRYGFESFAVLYRTNAQSRILEEAFLHRSIPYVLIGGTRFYERREIKDILAYLKLLANPLDTVAKNRIQKLGKRRFEQFKTFYSSVKNKVNMIPTAELMDQLFEHTKYLAKYDPDDEEDYERLENIKELKSVALNFPGLVEFLEQVALVESEYSEGEKGQDKKNRVKMMTLHAAKGLEFDCVFIVGVEEGILPHSRATHDALELEEERRLFYVGATRARDRLYILHARRRFIFGRRLESIKSRFLMDEESW